MIDPGVLPPGYVERLAPGPFRDRLWLTAELRAIGVPAIVLGVGNYLTTWRVQTALGKVDLDAEAVHLRRPLRWRFWCASCGVRAGVGWSSDVLISVETELGEFGKFNLCEMCAGWATQPHGVETVGQRIWQTLRCRRERAA